MKNMTLILTILFLVSFTASAFSDSITTETAVQTVAIDTTTDPEAAKKEEGPIIRKMRGRISSADVTKQSFKLTPNNIGEPISIVCDPTSSCSVSALIDGIDGNAEVYFQDGKWIAKSVNQTS